MVAGLLRLGSTKRDHAQTPGHRRALWPGRPACGPRRAGAGRPPRKNRARGGL